LQGKAEDEGGLTPAEDDNAALRKIDRNMSYKGF
jgi:hypothetical protein